MDLNNLKGTLENMWNSVLTFINSSPYIQYGAVAVIVLVALALLIKASKKVGLISFMGSVVDEVKKVEWLSRKELLFYSSLVILFIVFATLFIALVDMGLVESRTFLVTSNIF